MGHIVAQNKQGYLVKYDNLLFKSLLIVKKKDANKTDINYKSCMVLLWYSFVESGIIQEENFLVN